ncbi:MAG: peptidylprolyl isomerase [Candidatus Zixiibacteriota bacterium]
MCPVESGSKVKVHYTGKLEDGSIFDSSEGRPPLEFQIGEGQVIPGFEKGVMGMEVGDKKTVVIPPEHGYGDVREDLRADVKIDQFPDNIKPTVNQQLQVNQSDGTKLNVTVTNIEGDTVTLDANHPLAGKTLAFDVEVVEIN